MRWRTRCRFLAHWIRRSGRHPANGVPNARRALSVEQLVDIRRESVRTLIKEQRIEAFWVGGKSGQIQTRAAGQVRRSASGLGSIPADSSSAKTK